MIRRPSGRLGRWLRQEFREFFGKSNVVGLGIAVVIGAAVKTFVDAFAGGPDGHGVLGDLLAALIGDIEGDLTDAGVEVNGSLIPLGGLVVAGLNFVFVVGAVFLIVLVGRKFAESRRHDDDSDTETVKSTEDLLADILAELRQANDSTS